MHNLLLFILPMPRGCLMGETNVADEQMCNTKSTKLFLAPTLPWGHNMSNEVWRDKDERGTIPLYLIFLCREIKTNISQDPRLTKSDDDKLSSDGCCACVLIIKRKRRIKIEGNITVIRLIRSAWEKVLIMQENLFKNYFGTALSSREFV